MTEQIEMFVAQVLAAETTEAAVETYLAAPKVIRRAGFNLIREKNPDLAKRIRAAAEANRGIAFRLQDGDIVFKREEMLAQILRVAGKAKEMDTRKAALLERVVELKNQAKDIYGDDFIAEVETALETL
jgi:hypothetical protein